MLPAQVLILLPPQLMRRNRPSCESPQQRRWRWFNLSERTRGVRFEVLAVSTAGESCSGREESTQTHLRTHGVREEAEATNLSSASRLPLLIVRRWDALEPLGTLLLLPLETAAADCSSVSPDPGRPGPASGLKPSALPQRRLPQCRGFQTLLPADAKGPRPRRITQIKVMAAFPMPQREMRRSDVLDQRRDDPSEQILSGPSSLCPLSVLVIVVHQVLDEAEFLAVQHVASPGHCYGSGPPSSVSPLQTLPDGREPFRRSGDNVSTSDSAPLPAGLTCISITAFELSFKALPRGQAVSPPGPLSFSLTRVASGGVRLPVPFAQIEPVSFQLRRLAEEEAKAAQQEGGGAILRQQMWRGGTMYGCTALLQFSSLGLPCRAIALELTPDHDAESGQDGSSVGEVHRGGEVSEYIHKRIWATSEDGTPVPMSLVYSAVLHSKSQPPSMEPVDPARGPGGGEFSGQPSSAGHDACAGNGMWEGDLPRGTRVLLRVYGAFGLPDDLGYQPGR